MATEPFSEWVLEGEFKGERPAWDTAGAKFTDDVVPHELRKLWLLNGAHSLMAYAAPRSSGHHHRVGGYRRPGRARLGGRVVGRRSAEAARRDVITAYRAALLERFSNPRMHDQLSRIAADGSQKIPIRIVPALLADRKEGNSPLGAERAVAAWILHLRGARRPVQ